MQSFSCFSTKGPSMAAPHHYSSRGKKKSSSLADHFKTFRNLSTQIQNLEHEFLSGHCNLMYCSSKKSFFYLHCAQSPPLATDMVEVFEKEKVDVRALALRLSDARSADDVEQVLKDHDPLPLPVFSSIIRGFGLDKTVDPAFAIFEWLKRKGEASDDIASPNLFIYNSILGALKHSSQFEKIDCVIEEMRSKGILPNIVTYNTLMSVYIDQGKHEEALAILDEIERAKLSPSPATYSSVLLICRKMDDALGAIKFFVRFREEYENGYMDKYPNTDGKAEFIKLENFAIRICYLVMRQLLVNEENSTVKVFKILTVMDRAQLSPGRVEYERLIWACTRESHYNVAKELYQRIREVEEDGISLSVCNHVIWLMGKAKKWWAALEVYEDLLDKGPEPNTLSHELIISHFAILLDAAKKKGTWRWGVRLINKMLDRGLKPGIGEWNAVLIACSKASETSAAVEIFKRMVEHGERPTVLSYGALLSALEKGKLYDEALAVWEHMCKVGVKPNSHAYTILASVYIGNGMFEKVDFLIREMKDLKIEPNVVTFNAIITGCVRNGLSSAAFEWFHRMKIENIKPNEITYEMLIDGFVIDGKGRFAYEMYLRAMNEGLDLSPKAYDAVLDSCWACGISIDLSVLGQRPGEKKKFVRIRKDLSEFCHFADVPRRSRPFDSAEIYDSDTNGRL